MGLFNAVVMVDWSASSTPGSSVGGANDIWVASAVDDGLPEATPYRTRHSAALALRQQLHRHVRDGRRTLIGFDFVYGYPSGTVAALRLSDDIPPWQAMWELLRNRIVDSETNHNNRFDIAADLNRIIGNPPGPLWGVPRAQSSPDLASTKPTFPFQLTDGRALDEWRAVERVQRARGHRPKSAWQLYGAGSVGSQALMGLPYLASLRFDPQLARFSRVWPFETGFSQDPTGGLRPAIVHAEIYPSLQGDDDPTLHDIPDARQVLRMAMAFQRMDATGSLADAFAPSDLPPGSQEAAIQEEGWVLTPDIFGAPVVSSASSATSDFPYGPDAAPPTVQDRDWRSESTTPGLLRELLTSLRQDATKWWVSRRRTR